MMYHQKAIVRRPAAVDLTGKEGCFVTLTAAGVTPADAKTAPASVYGLLNSCTDEAGAGVSVILPGCDGIHAALASGAVADGDRLVLAAGGAVAKGSAGTAVAVALGAGASGDLVPVRIIEPVAMS